MNPSNKPFHWRGSFELSDLRACVMGYVENERYEDSADLDFRIEQQGVLLSTKGLLFMEKENKGKTDR